VSEEEQADMTDLDYVRGLEDAVEFICYDIVRTKDVEAIRKRLNGIYTDIHEMRLHLTRERLFFIGDSEETAKVTS
jgi:hypothetical protein